MGAPPCGFSTSCTCHGLSRILNRALPVSARNEPTPRSTAVKRSLAELGLRSLGGGRYFVPLLDPVRDGLPFAMALELHAERGSAQLPASWGNTDGDHRLFALRYVLDSDPQVALEKADPLDLRPGDSVLLPHCPDAWEVEQSTISIDASLHTWRLASLTLLLPDIVEQHPSGSVKLDASAAEEASRSWQAAPEIGRLSPEAVQSLMRGAQERAYSAFPPLHNQGLRHRVGDDLMPAGGGEARHAGLEGVDPALFGRWLSHLFHRGEPRCLEVESQPLPALPRPEPHPADEPGPHGGPPPGPSAASGPRWGALDNHEAAQPRLSHLPGWRGPPASNPHERDRLAVDTSSTFVHVGWDSDGEAGLADRLSLTESHASGGTGHGRDRVPLLGEAAHGGPGKRRAGGEADGGGRVQGRGDARGEGVAGLGPLQHILPSIAERIVRRLRRLSPRAGPLRRALQDLHAFQLPKQTNRLALVFDPLSDDVPFTFGVEIFEPGHKTPLHTHPTAHELFFILAGEGEAYCDGEWMAVGPGDVVVFPPLSVHGINTSPSHGKMYCLELMTTNDMFADLVRSGKPLGVLPAEDLCVLAAVGCG
eukprot:jgi/Botrbrau1/11952/Bobra.341_1s0017.1